MAKPKQKAIRTDRADVDGAYALWGHGDVRSARRIAGELLEASPDPESRPALERLLRDTAPDRWIYQITVFAVAVLGLVILLTRLFD